MKKWRHLGHFIQQQNKYWCTVDSLSHTGLLKTKYTTERTPSRDEEAFGRTVPILRREYEP